MLMSFLAVLIEVSSLAFAVPYLLFQLIQLLSPVSIRDPYWSPLFVAARGLNSQCV